MVPQTVPEDQWNAYTLDGKIPVRQWVLDYTDVQIRTYTKANIEDLIAKAKRRENNYYCGTDAWLYAALDKHPMRGRKVVVLGSEVPWYEAICLARGAHPVTVEYRHCRYQHPGIEVFTVDEYNAKPEVFDAAISISSFEHDGLGRYGDPLNPDGDFAAMARTKAMLKPGGLLFLAVPVGRDQLVWNAHRIYGSLRLPMLLRGWTVVDVFGLPDGLPYNDVFGDNDRQPVFVLRPE